MVRVSRTEWHARSRTHERDVTKDGQRNLRINWRHYLGILSCDDPALQDGHSSARHATDGAERAITRASAASPLKR